MNEIVETDEGANNLRTYVHGISYVDERLMMRYEDTQPYYYVIDRMYDVVALVDRAGSIVERYCYDPYGRPLIRESAARGDMDSDTDLDGTDSSRVTAAKNGTIWDPRADLDDDGDVDAADETAYAAKDDNWPPQSSPTVAQAFSDLGNPFMHPGRPHFALDTASDATEGTLLLNDHRARFNDPVIGRWVTRDPMDYNRRLLDIGLRRFVCGGLPVQPHSKTGRQATDGLGLYRFGESDPVNLLDPKGLTPLKGCTTANMTKAQEAMDRGCTCIRAAQAAAAQGQGNPPQCVKDMLDCMKGRCDATPPIHIHCDYCGLCCKLRTCTGHAFTCFLGRGNHVTICGFALDENFTVAVRGGLMAHEVSHCCGRKDSWMIGFDPACDGAVDVYIASHSTCY